MPWTAEDTEDAYLDYCGEQDGAFGGRAWGGGSPGYGGGPVVQHSDKEYTMPRATPSKESAILTWFETVDPAVATAVFNLVRDLLTTRNNRTTAALSARKVAPVKKRKPRPTPVHHAPVARVGPPAHRAKKKKSHHKKVTPAAPVAQAAVAESFGRN